MGVLAGPALGQLTRMMKDLESQYGALDPAFAKQLVGMAREVYGASPAPREKSTLEEETVRKQLPPALKRRS